MHRPHRLQPRPRPYANRPRSATPPRRRQCRPHGRKPAPAGSSRSAPIPAESEAQQRLAPVKSKASRLLASANPFTEPVQRGDTTLYRARFAGLDREQAEAACKFLKRNDVDCLAMRN